jgi:hypothetical protein
MPRDLFQESGVDLLTGENGQPRDLFAEQETKTSGFFASQKPGLGGMSFEEMQNKPKATRGIIEETPALAGALIGGTASTIAKRIPLVAVLSAGGEGYHQIYQHVTGSPDAPKTSLEAAKRMLLTGGEYAAGQAGGELITKGAAKLIPHIKKEYLVPGLEKAESTLRPYLEKYLPKSMQAKTGVGPGFTVAQKSEPFSAASKMENILESSFFGATPIKQFKYAQEKGVEDYAKNVVDEVWKGVEKMPSSAIGTNFHKAYETAYGQFTKQSENMFTEIDRIASSIKIPQTKTVTSRILGPNGQPIETTKTFMSNEIVDMRPLKKWASGLAEDYRAKAGIGQSQMGDTLLNKMTNVPDQVSFPEAQKIRTGLRLERQSFETRDIARGIATQGEKLTNTAMNEAAEILPNEGKKLWKDANNFYWKGMNTIDNEFIYKLAKTAKDQPELVGKQLFQNGEITQIKQVKEVLMPSPGNPISDYILPDFRTWQNMKAGYLESLLAKASDAQTGVISGSRLANALSSKGMGEEALRAIFTPQELESIRTFSTALTTIEKKAPAGGGSMLIQLMQAPALAGAVTAYGGFKKDPEIIAGGLTLLATPRILGKMLVSPRYHDLFVRGLSTLKPIAIPAITKLAVAAYDMGKEESDKFKPEITQKQTIGGKSPMTSNTPYGTKIGGSEDDNE